MTVYHVFANRINLGDYYSALGIKKLIWQIPMRSLYWTHGEFEKTKYILEKIKPHDKIVVGGGGLFKDFFSPLWETILNYVRRDNQLFIWGVGECDVKDKHTTLSESQLVRIAETATMIYTRDQTSKQKLQGFNARVEITGCPSVTIVSQWIRKSPRYLLHVIHPELLGASLGLWRQAASRLASDLGLDVVELSHIVPKSGIRRLNYLHKTKNYYQNAGLVLSSRLHGVIFSNAMGIPVIPVSGDKKIESYWRDTLGKKLLLNISDSNFLNKKLANKALNDVSTATIVDYMEKNRQAAKNILFMMRS
ncbi:MAG: polysaccharide pyruvyl transferase family protein [Anaerolineales bacterium]|nr:polysaccharide pyruvyl transferase family protein [Anaerolineales bacterium]